MYIDKAVKKQKASYKRFNVIMIFIVLLLPVVVFELGIKQKMVFVALILLEFIIILSIIIMKDKMTLKYTCENSVIRFKQGIFSSYKKISCDKIKLIHTENKTGDIELVLVTTTRIGNKKLRLIGKSFINKYPMAGKEYRRLKKIYPDKNYFYIVIKSGGLNKFALLDIIYRNSVTATFTDDTIENIKIARSNKEINKV